VLLEEDLFNARGDALKRGDSFTGTVLGQESFTVVGFNLLGGDVNALAETLLDEGENFKAVAEVGVDALGGEIVGGEEGLPSVVGGAVLADAGRELLADFSDAGGNFFGRWLVCLGVFAADLLLDQRTADELVKGVAASEDAEAGEGWVQDGEADFVVDVALEYGVTVDDGDNGVEDDGGLGTGGEGEEEENAGAERV
jgi:hypothetical protein